MADSPRSETSHDSSPATGKSHPPKDKKCQFCHQHFTSSSLGRHLDQFIFRKKPDGIHNVEEIRRRRGGITRRTNKGGANAKQDPETSFSTPHTTSPANRDSPVGESRVDLNATPVEGYRVRLNAPNWQSTGVINGLSGSSTVSPALESVTPATGKRNYSSIETAAAKDILGLRGDLGSEKDTARALELALRELLDTIQAAHVKTTPAPSPFSIDIQFHTFPSLALHLLASPPTLLTSSTPFATPESFPISSPPDHSHLNLLRSTIISLTTSWKSDLLHSPLPPQYPDKNTYTSHINSTATTHSTTALKHLDLAYKHYTSLPISQQQEIWQIELAKAYASEKQKKKEVEESLEAVMAEARQLSGQVEYLSRCQWPREMALWPPERRPIRSNIIRKLESGAVREPEWRKRAPGQGAAAEVDSHQQDEDEDEDDKRWDYDTLVRKWKKVVREDAVRKRGLALPVPITPVTAGGGSGAGGTTNTINTPISSTAAATRPAPTTEKEDHFEPWCKKPRFVGDEDCLIGIPGSSKQQQQQQQQQQQPQWYSNLRDLVTDDRNGTGTQNGNAIRRENLNGNNETRMDHDVMRY